ncbi:MULTISPECIES: hypothetical protein [unclassified Cupriavidus]|uniref:hypothetical protein n=1 Tax=unclassified Cupriavidus TaxID=2640874 RepID=UPI001AE366E9|nr:MULTISPECIES: hypothetical protein [unclassified Cupriavidus]MBP0632576.1 hypothetical protein [Cupriavidus sp. AcVe19-1a]MBP0634619.1 hypothetical protein [Cupriavidus sp. AcVe19-6a]
MIAGFGGKLIAGAAERDCVGDFAIPRHLLTLAESDSKDQPVILQSLALPPSTRAGTRKRVLTAASCPDASARRLLRQAQSSQFRLRRQAFLTSELMRVNTSRHDVLTRAPSIKNPLFQGLLVNTRKPGQMKAP